MFRQEKDLIGTKEINKDVLYGIHSIRAKENFLEQNIFPLEWYKAIGSVKKACYITIQKYKQALQEQNIKFDLHISDEILNALIYSAEQIEKGSFFEYFIVPSHSGGAGTSINMNINEIITNLSLLQIKKQIGEYDYIDPFIHANMYQSTNDVIPTALKIAMFKGIVNLETKINILRNFMQEKEQTYSNLLRFSYTQMQEAVPSTWGRLFGAYAEAFSRDWQRLSKCYERIKYVNLGGGASGSGLAVPRFYIFNVVNELKQITNLPLARSEHLTDTTSNNDILVEVHAILKALAVNLEKIASDLRLLSADIGQKFINIPARQNGSSIMPGKINPVIIEYIINVAHRVYANDLLISSLCAQGTLDLNAYIPTIGHAFLETLAILSSAIHGMANFLVKDLEVNIQTNEEIMQKIINSPIATTILLPIIGYHKSTLLAKYMKNNNIDIFTANTKLQYIDEKLLNNIICIENFIKLGFNYKDYE